MSKTRGEEGERGRERKKERETSLDTNDGELESPHPANVDLDCSGINGIAVCVSEGKIPNIHLDNTVVPPAFTCWFTPKQEQLCIVWVRFMANT